MDLLHSYVSFCNDATFTAAHVNVFRCWRVTQITKPPACKQRDSLRKSSNFGHELCPGPNAPCRPSAPGARNASPLYEATKCCSSGLPSGHPNSTSPHLQGMDSTKNLKQNNSKPAFLAHRSALAWISPSDVLTLQEPWGQLLLQQHTGTGASAPPK